MPASRIRWASIFLQWKFSCLNENSFAKQGCVSFHRILKPCRALISVAPFCIFQSGELNPQAPPFSPKESVKKGRTRSRLFLAWRQHWMRNEELPLAQRKWLIRKFLWFQCLYLKFRKESKWIWISVRYLNLKVGKGKWEFSLNQISAFSQKCFFLIRHGSKFLAFSSGLSDSGHLRQNH